MEAESNRCIPYIITGRRPGNVAISVADPRQALERLGWRTKRTLKDICRVSWAWQQANQNGYS
ncbi:UDP-glucose 4-epimerase C-term subunit [Synechococcus sp. WH 8103]|nr:UDP-glucose 4-epimerase C-term subunit [Synechococcus sp. WH 8103]